MPRVTMAQVGEIARNLGHTNLSVDPTPAGSSWVASCSCGYRSVNKRTSAQAAGAAAHHLDLIVKAWSSSGAPFPKASS